MKKTGPLHYLGILFVFAVFLLAAWLLYRQWHGNHLTLAGVSAHLLDIPKGWMLVAVGLTVINYGILSGYDLLAFRFAKVPISLARVAFAAVTSYSFSYNFGERWRYSAALSTLLGLEHPAGHDRAVAGDHGVHVLVRRLRAGGSVVCHNAAQDSAFA